MFSLHVDNEIVLGLLEERHVEALFALTEQNRSYLRQWLPWVDGTLSVADSRAFQHDALERFARNGAFQAGIIYHGQLVGMIGLHVTDRTNRKTSIGYWLAQRFQGKGIMTRACRALVSYVFNELGLNRVEIRCGTGNLKSRAIPERLGFTLEGTIRQDAWIYDHFIDHAVYSMLATKWQAKGEQSA